MRFEQIVSELRKHGCKVDREKIKGNMISQLRRHFPKESKIIVTPSQNDLKIIKSGELIQH